MRRSISIIFVFLVITGLLPVAAQEQAADCTAILLAYRELKSGSLDDLESIALLQDWRYTLEAADPIPCDANAYRALVKAINLTGDSIVSNMLHKDDEATSRQAEASVQEAIAVELLLGSAVDTGATIASPADGETVPSHLLVVTGTNSPNYGFTTPDQLWVFVVPASNQRRYPQIVDGCDPNAWSSVVYEDGTWSITATLGKEVEGRGEAYIIMLMSADSAATSTLYDKFDGWCKINNYPGLSAREISEIEGLHQLQRITVTRAP
jgi:hypothetical protein